MRPVCWLSVEHGEPRRIGWTQPDLLRTLMALERGEAQVCRVVHAPSREQEDIRRRSRERARLVVERGQHSSRIEGC
jgi:transposase